ncbi:MAG: prepilin peptidase [Myxococcota bacterium]
MNPTLLWQIAGGLAAVSGLLMSIPVTRAIDRWPDDQTIFDAPRCPRCGHRLSALEQLPIVSWLFLKGRCSRCNSPIPAVYPVIEALCGVLAWLLFRRFVPEPDMLDGTHLAAVGVFSIYTMLLVVQSLVDLRHQIIPDETSINAVPVGIVTAVLLDVVGFPGAIGWEMSILGALAGGLGMFAIFLVGAVVTGRVAMGFGDVKLMAMIGSFLGPWALFSVLFTGSVVGAAAGLLMIANGRNAGAGIPFGPFLAFGAITYVVHEQTFFDVGAVLAELIPI